MFLDLVVQSLLKFKKRMIWDNYAGMIPKLLRYEKNLDNDNLLKLQMEHIFSTGNLFIFSFLVCYGERGYVKNENDTHTLLSHSW